MNEKTRSTKSEKWRHTCNSVEIAWTNEQKVAVTSNGRNKNHDDEIKKHSKTSPDVQFKEFSLTKQKNQSEIAACEQKTTTEKPNFCSNTIFSLYFKIRAKKIHAAKPLAFSLHFLFRRDQNTPFFWTTGRDQQNKRFSSQYNFLPFPSGLRHLKKVQTTTTYF